MKKIKKNPPPPQEEGEEGDVGKYRKKGNIRGRRMTEKEIAKKVWDVVDMYGDEFGVTVLAREIEKILPRPKRKVEKTMWSMIGKNNLTGGYYTGGLHDEKEHAQETGMGFALGKITFEVEE